MILECIPNFSTIDQATLAKLKLAISSQPETKLLHVDPGKSANRTVFTFAGPTNAVLQTARNLLEVSTKEIDMRRQKGTHPRIGSCDVLPFVPLGHWDEKSLADLKTRIADMVGDFSSKSELPFYFYEGLASSEERKNLANLRRGQFEGLAERMQKVEFAPDVGPTKPHPSAGVTAVGIRNLLLAFNINVTSCDLAKVKLIATKLRPTNPKKHYSFPGLKTLGWWVEEFGMCQISTNITQIEKVNIVDLYRAVAKEAKGFDFDVDGCELVGLMPKSALQKACERLAKDEESTARYLGLNRVKPFSIQANILENALQKAGIHIF